MSKIFVTADLHFYHENIINYANRPFRSVKHMNETIISNWNRVVSNKDKVFVLGDVGFGTKEQLKETIMSLNGNKILIMGNHDGNSIQKWMDCGFKEVYKYPIIYKNYIVMSHEPPMFFNDAIPYIYFYGHVHDTDMYTTVTKSTACLCMERWNYTPVNMNDVFNIMKLSRR